jgi:hypothetical protein
MSAEVDATHLLPPEEWAEVVAQAAIEAERIAAGHPVGAWSLRGTVFDPREAAQGELVTDAEGAPLRFGTGVAAPLAGVVTAPSNGGPRAGGRPTFGVIHTAETPLAAGYAASIARYFGRGPGTSCHYMTDPAEAWGVLPDELIAWHVGNGNTNSVGLEQAGYASLPREAWLGADGMAQMTRNAQIMRGARDRYGIGLHMMTDAELLAAHRRQIVGGWATHDQCRRVLGGTTHTDPGNFPVDVQMQLANDGAIPSPSPAPAPTPAPVPALGPAPGWPLPAGHYLGNIKGPAASHGGYYASERPAVLYAQRKFIALGCVPGVGDWRSGWADGRWEDATDAACRRWFARYRPGQPFTTRIYRDDWAVLAR